METQTNAPREKWEDALKRIIGEERFGEARPNIRYEELMELLSGNHPEAIIDLSERECELGDKSLSRIRPGSVGAIIPPACTADTVRACAAHGIAFALVSTQCSRETLIEAARTGSRPFHFPITTPLPNKSAFDFRTDLREAPHSREVKMRLQHGAEIVCDTADAELISAFVESGGIDRVDPVSAAESGSPEMLDLVERQDGCSDVSDAILARMNPQRFYDSVGYTHLISFAPNRLIALAKSGIGLDWDSIAADLLEYYEQSHDFGFQLDFRVDDSCRFPNDGEERIDWPSVFKAVLPKTSDEFQGRIRVSMKETTLSSAKFGNPSSRYWLPEDEEVYPLLAEHGVELESDATPEAIFVHCLPKTAALLLAKRGLTFDDVVLTPGKVSQCVVRSESSHALAWLFENRPELVDLSKIDKKKILADEFLKTVRRLERKAKSNPPRPAAKTHAKKPTVAQRTKTAIAAAKKGDLEPFFDLAEDGGAVKPKPLADLMDAIAMHGDSKAVDRLFERFDAGSAPLPANEKRFLRFSGIEETRANYSVWEGIKLGNKASTLAFLNHGAFLGELQALHFAEGWETEKKALDVLRDLLEEAPESLKPQALVFYAVRFDRPDILESALRASLAQSGDGSCLPQVVLSPARGVAPKQFFNVREAMSPRISPRCAKVLCEFLPDTIGKSWRREFLDGDLSVAALLVDYVDGNTAEGGRRALATFAKADRLSTVKKVAEWKGASTQASLDEAIRAAHSAGSTKSLAWLEKRRAALYGA